MFGPYGRADDLVYVGDTGQDASTPPGPVAAAPYTFEYSRLRGWRASGLPERELSQYFLQSCNLAARRGVRVNAVYIGDRRDTRNIHVLESCVDLAGGTAGTADVLVTPTSAELTAALEQLFTFRRNLRFLDN